MFIIDLIERKVGDINSKVIPLDNLSPEDLDWIGSLSGKMTEEIYNQGGHVDRVRTCDKHLINIDVVRIILIKECVLLWTILQGSLKRHPQVEQLCAWLNETKHTQKGELMIREQEVHESVDQVGPSCLFGANLEEAMKAQPNSGGTFVMNASTSAPLHAGDSMTDEDMKAMFERGSIDFSVEPEKELEEIMLIDVVPPPFKVDFEVEEGDPTELTDDEEFELGFEALTASDEKDLVEEAV